MVHGTLVVLHNPNVHVSTSFISANQHHLLAAIVAIQLPLVSCETLVECSLPVPGFASCHWYRVMP